MENFDIGGRDAGTLTDSESASETRQRDLVTLGAPKIGTHALQPPANPESVCAR